MRKPYLEAFFFALATLLLEVSYTRVFSFKLVYYFTYLVIGIALLGLGAGGVLVAVSRWLRDAALERLLALCSLVAAAAVLVSYFVVADTPLNLFALVLQASRGGWSTVALESAKLAAVCAILFVPFLASGIALAKIFSSQSDDIGRLYFADLAGAALGCALVVPAIEWITPPGTVFLAGLCFAIAGARLTLSLSRARVVVLGAVAALLLLGALLPDRLPDPLPDRIKARGKRIESVFSRWSAVFRVDVLPVALTTPVVHFLIHDGTPGSTMIEYDGKPESLGRYESDERALPFRMLRKQPSVAIIGSAGGNEILASLHFDAQKITGIELNPVTVSLLTTHFADFTGHLTQDPRVKIINAEGRSFLASTREQFDLIWLVAPDSYAAMNAATSGAFVLSESYLYTKEMIVEALRHLAPGGILSAQFGEIDFDHKPNRTLRYLGTAREAMRERGITDFARHVLVAESPAYRKLQTATILLRKEPFSAQEIEQFAAATKLARETKVIHASAAGAEAGDAGAATAEAAAGAASEEGTKSAVRNVIVDEGAALRDFYAGYPFDVRPIDDDSPFFWNFVRFRDLMPWGSEHNLSIEEGVGERLLFVLLGLAAVFATVFLLLPLVRLGPVWREIPYKSRAAVYFAALGLGFMLFEVCLIQRFTLFLGYPTYSLTVTLFAMLVSTGLGSLLSERLVANRDRALKVLAVLLVALVLVLVFVVPTVMRGCVGFSLSARVILTVLWLTPLGVALGCFLPLGIRSVAEITVHREAFVAWCWAVNGFFSVLSSVLATMLSMSLGFNALMGVGLAIYLIGILAMLGIPAPRLASGVATAAPHA